MNGWGGEGGGRIFRRSLQDCSVESARLRLVRELTVSDELFVNNLSQYINVWTYWTKPSDTT